MTELEKIAYAKSFIDKLAKGINPLNDMPIPEGTSLTMFACPDAFSMYQIF